MQTMCRVLEVSVSGYYAWKKRPLCARKREDGELTQQIANSSCSIVESMAAMERRLRSPRETKHLCFETPPGPARRPWRGFSRFPQGEHIQQLPLDQERGRPGPRTAIWMMAASRPAMIQGQLRVGVSGSSLAMVVAPGLFPMENKSMMGAMPPK